MSDNDIERLIASIMSILASLCFSVAICWFFGPVWALLAFSVTVTVTINSVRINRRQK